MAHWSASATFDLPEPFGPTITETPRSKTRSTVSAKLLNPRRRTDLRCTSPSSLLATERGQSGPRGLLLRPLLCGARAAPERTPVNRGNGLEGAGVGWAGVTHHGVLYGTALTLQPLLQLRLVVDVAALGPLDPLGEAHDDRRGDRVVAAREQPGPDHRLGQRREDARVGGELVGVVAPERDAALAQVAAEVEVARDLGAARPRDDLRLQDRESALVSRGETPVELSRNGRAEDSIAQELEPLVGVAAFGQPGGVREGARA